MRPEPQPSKALAAARNAVMRRATLNPYDVVVLAAVEAVFRSEARVAPPALQEICLAADLGGDVALGCLRGSLARQHLVAELDSITGPGWVLTPLGAEVLAELVVADRRRRYR